METIKRKIEWYQDRAEWHGGFAIMAISLTPKCDSLSMTDYAYTGAREAAHYGRKALLLMITLQLAEVQSV